MAEFPIQYAKELPTGRAAVARADLDVRTGAEEMARAVSGLGAALFESGQRIADAQKAMEFSTFKRKDEEFRLSALQALKAPGFDVNDDEAIVALKEKLNTDRDALNSKWQSVNDTYQMYRNGIDPRWEIEFEGVLQDIKARNVKDEFSLNAENLLGKGKMLEYQTLLEISLATDVISKAEYDFRTESAPNDSILQQMRIQIGNAAVEPDVNERLRILQVAIELSGQMTDPSADQMDYRDKLLRMAQPQLGEQQDSLRIEAANLWFDDQLTIDWLRARQNVMAADDYERFVTSLKTDKALKSDNVVLNKLRDSVYDVQRGVLSHAEFAKQATITATVPYTDNRPAITQGDYEDLLADSRREFASYQANTMKTALGEIYDQVVTIKQSTLEAMATYLTAGQMMDAENRRQKEEDEYAEISKELRDWFSNNPEAGSDDFYKKKRELLALSKKHTADEIRSLRDAGQFRKYIQERAGKVENDFILNDEGQKVLTHTGAQNLLIETGYDVEKAKALARERDLIDPE